MPLKLFTDKPLEIEFRQHGFILARVDGEVYTNVPHAAVWHSPDGFEFGYMGSGPADLALNILEAALSATGYKGERTRPGELYERHTCFKLAARLHQGFKRMYIAPLTQDRDGWHVISLGEVMSFINWQRAELSLDL